MSVSKQQVQEAPAGDITAAYMTAYSRQPALRVRFTAGVMKPL